jgi:hypothetical protein
MKDYKEENSSYQAMMWLYEKGYISDEDLPRHKQNLLAKAYLRDHPITHE